MTRHRAAPCATDTPRRARPPLVRNQSGSVLTIAAIMLPVLLGFVALSAEYGLGLLARMENQRVADSASYAGALAYSASNDESDMVAAARAVAGLNGIAPESVDTRLAPSPRDASLQVVHVTIATRNTLFIAPILGVDPWLDIAADSYASLGGEAAPACILALDPGGSGVTLSGGVAVNAPDCTVSSNAAITAPCGTSITALQVTYDAGPAIADCPWSVNVRDKSGDRANALRKATSDPFAAHPGVAALSARLETLEHAPRPTLPVVAPGPDIDFGWDQNRTRSQAQAAGCTAAWSQPVWTLTCPVGDHRFGAITVGGGIEVRFNHTGDPANSYTFSGPVTSNGPSLLFGPGTYVLARGVVASGNYRIAFGAGRFTIGPSQSHTCDGAGMVAVCQTGSASLTFDGPSRFTIVGGVASNGQGRISFGNGADNAYRITASPMGHAIWVGDGSKTTFHDATGPQGEFTVQGDIRTGGGTCLTLPAIAHHDISGSIDGEGALRLGAGVYTITGYFALGARAGGTSACDTGRVSLEARDVTIVIGGQATATAGCHGQIFCATAGYNGMVLSAPETGPHAGIALVGPRTGSQAGALFSGGASGGRISGAFYVPRGPIALNGGAGIAGGETCLQLIGTTITLSGGTSALSECVTAAAGGAGAAGPITWVQ